jgi:hypothetical protein
VKKLAKMYILEFVPEKLRENSVLKFYDFFYKPSVLESITEHFVFLLRYHIVSNATLD